MTAIPYLKQQQYGRFLTALKAEHEAHGRPKPLADLEEKEAFERETFYLPSNVASVMQFIDDQSCDPSLAINAARTIRHQSLRRDLIQELAARIDSYVSHKLSSSAGVGVREVIQRLTGSFCVALSCPEDRKALFMATRYLGRELLVAAHPEYDAFYGPDGIQTALTEVCNKRFEAVIYLRRVGGCVKHLDVRCFASNTGQVNNRVVASLLSALPHLKTLNLSGCTNIDVQAFKGGHAHLQKIVLEGLPLTTLAPYQDKFPPNIKVINQHPSDCVLS